MATKKTTDHEIITEARTIIALILVAALVIGAIVTGVIYKITGNWELAKAFFLIVPAVCFLYAMYRLFILLEDLEIEIKDKNQKIEDLEFAVRQYKVTLKEEERLMEEIKATEEAQPSKEETRQKGPLFGLHRKVKAKQQPETEQHSGESPKTMKDIFEQFGDILGDEKKAPPTKEEQEPKAAQEPKVEQQPEEGTEPKENFFEKMKKYFEDVDKTSTNT